MIPAANTDPTVPRTIKPIIAIAVNFFILSSHVAHWDRQGLEYRVSQPNLDAPYNGFTSTGENSMYSFQNKDTGNLTFSESRLGAGLLAACGFSSDLFPCIGQIPVELLR